MKNNFNDLLKKLYQQKRLIEHKKIKKQIELIRQDQLKNIQKILDYYE